MAESEQYGFTLIELSISLIIIGLVIGAVTIGRDLIHAAQLRKVISQVEAYKTAANTFRSKYNCLPGDCPIATNFFPAAGDCPGTVSTTATCNGNGDEKIWGGQLDYNLAASNQTVNAYEIDYFWQHLALAGLVSGSYTTDVSYFAVPDKTCPRIFDTGCVTTIYGNNLSNGWPAATNGINLFVLGIDDGLFDQNLLFSTNDAYSIDVKMDDGQPFSGSVTGFYRSTYTMCGDDATNTYQHRDTYTPGIGVGADGCALFINAGF